MTETHSIYRERFAATMAHQPVDRCPIDLGGTPQSTVEDDSAVTELARFLGLQGNRPAVYDKFDTRILELLDVDFRRTGELVPFTTDRNHRISDVEYIDCYGIRYRFTGIYWEIAGSELQGASLDDLASYDFPDIKQAPSSAIDRWEPDARLLHDSTPYVIVAEHPVLGVLELACWLCGYDHIMMMMALNPEFIHLLFGKILAFQKSVISEYYPRVGPHIHLTTSGDDFGTQNGLFMSPTMWREFVKPYMKERIDYTAQFTDAVYMHHSCGSIAGIIPDLVEIGVRILNPIQPAARGMEPGGLKADFGAMITFHGGLDTQEVLPSNDADRIDEAVGHLLEAMRPQAVGGYVFAPAHNLQSDVSPEAIMAMYMAAHRRQGSRCPAMGIGFEGSDITELRYRGARRT